MKIADVSFSYNEQLVTEEQVLNQNYVTVGWAEALQQQQAEVVVMIRFSKKISLIKNGVQYNFIKDNLRSQLQTWQVPIRFLQKIKRLNADIVLVHGFMFPMAIFSLKLLLPKKTAIVIQHHGGIPSKRLKGYVYGFLNSFANAYFFTTKQQGIDWFKQKREANKVLPIMEASHFFSSNNKAIAKNETAFHGCPIFIWVGRLDQNKDPLTVLYGFEKIAEHYKTATLYMVYSDDKMLNEVKLKIACSPILKKAVYLLGKINHETMQDYYNSADYFVLGSHYEGSGYALSEALACGCVPIVTGIPSFRMMTDEGKLGALWQTGNSQSFVEAVNIAMAKNIEIESKKCVDFFNEHLSYNAIAATAINHYQLVIDNRLQV